MEPLVYRTAWKNRNCKFCGMQFLLLLTVLPSLLSDNRQITQLPFLNYIMNPCGLTIQPIQTSNKITMKPYFVEDAELVKASQFAMIAAQELGTALKITDCNGLILDSLSPIPELSSLTMESSLETITNVMVNYLTHMYFIIYQPATLNCNKTIAQEFNRLASRLQYVLCNILQMLPRPQTSIGRALRQLINKKSYVYASCSAIQMEECLILTGTEELLQTFTDHLTKPLYSKNHLTPSV